MINLILVAMSATGLIILGYRVISIGTAETWNEKWRAAGRCVIDWGLSISLAMMGSMCGGVMGGAAGLIAGPIVSMLISPPKLKPKRRKEVPFKKGSIKKWSLTL